MRLHNRLGGFYGLECGDGGGRNGYFGRFLVMGFDVM
jgi:hypothetical protein